MPKVRAYGADATLKACREMSYGSAPLTGYRSLDLKSTDLSSAQPLGDDPLLGRSRNAQDPYRGLVTDEGQLEIPLDLRGTGFWLTGLFGDPVSLDYGFSFVNGYGLRFELPRVFLPKPKYSVTGPGGVEASFDWRAAFDDGEGTMLRVHLLNDVASYS